nr:hypothetical protein Iba_chr09dCG14220 [Ipomoea batatas]
MILQRPFSQLGIARAVEPDAAHQNIGLTRPRRNSGSRLRRDCRDRRRFEPTVVRTYVPYLYTLSAAQALPSQESQTQSRLPSLAISSAR